MFPNFSRGPTFAILAKNRKMTSFFLKYKFFLWSYIRHLNPRKTHPERITKANGMISGLDYDNYCWTEKENSICINVLCYKNDLVYQFMYRMRNLKIV